MLSSSSFVFTHSSTICSSCVLTASGPPRSSRRSARQAVRARPTVVRLSMARLPRFRREPLRDSSPCFE
jgi:hypothetical protein